MRELLRKVSSYSVIAAAGDCQPADDVEHSLHPEPGLRFQTVQRGKISQAEVSLGWIDSARPPDFSQALLTEFERLGIRFFAVIRAVHTAQVRRAVRNAQHVAGFMCRGFERADET
jgi:hypothetical protein